MNKLLYILFFFISSESFGQIAYFEQATANSNSGTTTYSTGSYTPTAGALLLAVVTSSKASTPDIPTFSGNGLTWVQVETETFDVIATPTKRITVFRAMGTASTGTATATFANAQTGASILIVGFTGTDKSGTNGSGAIAQAVKNNSDATANPNVTMSAISNAANAVISFFSIDVSGGITAPESGWTATTLLNRIGSQVYGEYRLTTTDNTPTVTASSADWAGIAIEIKAPGRRIISAN